jgi:hypothetical protein
MTSKEGEIEGKKTIFPLHRKVTIGVRVSYSFLCWEDGERE